VSKTLTLPLDKYFYLCYNRCIAQISLQFSKEVPLLSDKKISNKKVPVRRPVDSQKRWGDKQKLEAVSTYVVLGGNATQTAIALQIPAETLRQWTKTTWWKDLYDEVKQEENIELSHKLQKIVARSLALVEDRLEKGDFFYDQKTGQVVRKEVSLRDAHEVMKSSFQMRESIEKPQAAEMEEGSISDKLSQLAKQFEQFAVAQKEKAPINVTDVMFIEDKGNDDAVHEERKEGLQN
jgi:transposase-like protein